MKYIVLMWLAIHYIHLTTLENPWAPRKALPAQKSSCALIQHEHIERQHISLVVLKKTQHPTLTSVYRSSISFFSMQLN